MKTRKTIITAILLSAVLLGSLLVPVFAAADSLYIIPDSDTRALTYDELWEYRYDTLLYAFTVFSLFILCKLNCFVKNLQLFLHGKLNKLCLLQLYLRYFQKRIIVIQKP